MITLSDKIEVTITYTAPANDTYYNYYVSTSSSYIDAIYSGRFFAKAGSTSVKIYLTDILLSQRPTHNILDDYIQHIVNSEYQLVKKYYVIAYVPNVRTTDVDVLLAYKYPFKDFEMGGVQVGSAGVMPLILGVKNYDASALYKQSAILYPKYPKVGSNKFNITLAFCNGLNFNNDKTYLVTLDAEDNVENQVYWSQWDTFTSRTGAKSSSVPFTENTKYIGIQNKAIGETTEITGKKLWRVSIQDQWQIGDGNLVSLAETLGYDEYYTRHFYVDNGIDYSIDFLYETNNPEEIDRAFEDAECYLQHQYEEVSTVDHWHISYEFNDTTPLTGARYTDFVDFMCEAIESIDEDFINDVWGIREGEAISDTLEISFPYMVPVEDAMFTWRTYFEEYSTSETFTYEDFFNYDSSETISLQYDETYSEQKIVKTLKFAEVDNCIAKYYLQWIDRMGGVQCLPFDGKETKTIQYSKTNIANQYGQQRLVNSINTLQFEINSGWLKDEYMPIYEGIFVSPFVKLWDTENDKVYEILSADSEFTEMTKKNQGKMFNLTLKLNVNEKENILY